MTSGVGTFLCRKGSQWYDCINVWGSNPTDPSFLEFTFLGTGHFCSLGDRLNASGGCEIAVTSRVWIGWMKFRECKELLRRRRFSLGMKGMVYRSCVRSTMLY